MRTWIGQPYYRIFGTIKVNETYNSVAYILPGSHDVLVSKRLLDIPRKLPPWSLTDRKVIWEEMNEAALCKATITKIACPASQVLGITMPPIEQYSVNSVLKLRFWHGACPFRASLINCSHFQCEDWR
jgi:hypothetical protein